VTRLRTAPRKRAQQERSRAMVDAILEATARVLIAIGYDRASTKRIAEEAGISIGSLYQYFPSKEAVVAALMERHVASVLALVQGELAALAGAELPDAVRAVVTAFFRAQHVDRRLRRVFVEQVPRVGKLDRLREIEAQVAALGRAYLEQRRIARPDAALAAVVVVRTVAALTYQALIDDAGVSEERWIDEIAEVVLGYLSGGG
jgi:AcrR family transcriptional regulator